MLDILERSVVVQRHYCERNMSGDDGVLWEVHDIATEFDILGHLGSGAFATVMLARHIATGQVCAIKKRRKNRESDNRVLSECYWLRHFRNPFVVQL
jgi:serine/threonine protein kinase